MKYAVRLYDYTYPNPQPLPPTHPLPSPLMFWGLHTFKDEILWTILSGYTWHIYYIAFKQYRIRQSLNKIHTCTSMYALLI